MHPVLFHLGPVLIPAYGALAALGVLAALLLTQRTARTAGVDARHVWNLSVLALFSALIGSRLLLVAVNLSALRLHPGWLPGLSMVHHPLLTGLASAMGAKAALVYAHRRRMDLRKTADALAAPLALGLAFEQIGALLAGSGYGVDATGFSTHWAVTYTDLRAALWSGTPLGVPLHPVQAYAALAFLTLAAALLVALPLRRRPGDVSGAALMGLGTIIFFTEFRRDPEGRGALLGGAIDGPQAAAVLLLLAGAALLLRQTEQRMEIEEVHE